MDNHEKLHLRSSSVTADTSDKTNNNNFQEIVTFVDTKPAPKDALKPKYDKQLQHQQQHEKRQQQRQQHNKQVERTKKTRNNKKGTKKHATTYTIKTIQEWRDIYNHQCHNDTVTTGEILQTLERIYYPPRNPDANLVHNNNVHDNRILPCRYTFLDLGANIGDSLGKFIDSGMDACPTKEDGNNKLVARTPKYNLDTGVVDQFHEKENVLVQFARQVTRTMMRNNNNNNNQPLPQESSSPPSPRYPEQYCYYGVEGNPVFTARLQVLQHQVLNTHPRPLRHAHFFTETVGAGVDGPTTLYLDTVSTDKNFWGSSVLTQPKYVRESADKYNHGKPIGAPVQGMTLSTLVKQTVLATEPGAHLIVKVDIEGGEYALMQEVHQSGVLCDYVQNKGVVVDMLLEKHEPQFKAANLDMQLWESFIRDLRSCGVNIQGGANAG